MKYKMIVTIVIIAFIVGCNPTPNPPDPSDPSDPPKVVPPPPKGVLPMEAEVLNWLKTNGVTVEMPHSHLYKVLERRNKPFDKFYEITWRVEFKDITPAMNPGDPISPKPGSFASFPRAYSWDSGKHSYDDLLKIKKDYQKDLAGGFVVK